MSTLSTHNAVITSASLTIADHGALSSFIALDYGQNVGQCFGGWMLGVLPDGVELSRELTTADWIIRVMQIAGVTEWGSLPGRHIRVRGTRQKIAAIGHILTDDWFDPRLRWENVE